MASSVGKSIAGTRQANLNGILPSEDDGERH